MLFRVFMLLLATGLILPVMPASLNAAAPPQISDVPRITVSELVEMQKSGPVLIIDTRAPGQWKQAKDMVPGAMRVTSREQLQQLRDKYPPDMPIVTYCT